MKGQRVDGYVFAEDLTWLRSFHMTDEAVARSLGISLDALQKRISRLDRRSA